MDITKELINLFVEIKIDQSQNQNFVEDKRIYVSKGKNEIKNQIYYSMICKSLNIQYSLKYIT